MKVRDLCICDVAAATRDTSLARAGSLMRKYSIGSLPVVDRSDRVIGMVTDRDLLLELARRNATPSEIYVDEVMVDRPAVCDPQDSVQDCLDIMRRNRVRRLPVVDEEGRLEGIVSIDDIICHAVEDGDRGIPYEAVIETLCEITKAYQAETGAHTAHGEPARGPQGRYKYKEESPRFEEPGTRRRRPRIEEEVRAPKPRGERPR